MVKIMACKNRRLLGRWVSHCEGEDPQYDGENTTLEFKEDGCLNYTIRTLGKDQKIFLTYQVEGGVIITDQPSHPQKEYTRFFFTEDGMLVLIYGGQRSIYVRE